MLHQLPGMSSFLISTFPVHSVPFFLNFLPPPFFSRDVRLMQVPVWACEIKRSPCSSSKVTDAEGRKQGLFHQ